MWSCSDEALADRLLARARDGEEGARGELLEGFREYLEVLARGSIGARLHSKVDAADLVQETFLEAHRNFDLFRGEGRGAFVAWLRGILFAKLSNLLRRFLGTQGRDVRREEGLQPPQDGSSSPFGGGLAAPESTPSRVACRKEEAMQLTQALAALPDDYREVILLRHVDELSYPEIAERMQRSQASVQKLWVRALARLRQSIGDSV